MLLAAIIYQIRLHGNLLIGLEKDVSPELSNGLDACSRVLDLLLGRHIHKRFLGSTLESYHCSSRDYIASTGEQFRVQSRIVGRLLLNEPIKPPVNGARAAKKAIP